MIHLNTLNYLFKNLLQNLIRFKWTTVGCCYSDNGASCVRQSLMEEASNIAGKTTFTNITIIISFEMNLDLSFNFRLLVSNIARL